MHQTAIKESVKLEKIFIARNLERIAGVEVDGLATSLIIYGLEMMLVAT